MGIAMQFIFRFSLFLQFAMCVSVPAWAAEQIRDYPLTKIAAHTYVIHGPIGYPSAENQGFMNNPGFVITKTGVVVIDPGSTVQVGRMVLKQIHSVTDKPVTHVFDTHVHGDHWLGNQAIKEAYPKVVLMGHADMIKKIKEGEGTSWVNTMESMTKGASKGTRSVPPDVAVQDKQELKIGGMTFRVYSTDNAHSHSDIMLEVVEDSVVFAGDNVLNQTIARMDDATFKGSIAACDRIAALKAKHYVPGHGPTGDVSIVTSYRNYLSTVFDNVKQQYALGKADFEMKADIAAKLKPYANWDRFDDQLGKHISLAVLEVEASM
jgi:glyoxylase-like metal-dependent hydrolase (beta-lactamase superfamily II)